MFKFILFIVIVLFVIGSGNVFDFSSDNTADTWLITVNHQELLGSIPNGFNIVYDFVGELVRTTSETTTTPTPITTK